MGERGVVRARRGASEDGGIALRAGRQNRTLERREDAAELAEQHIRVNAVNPGAIETPLHRSPGQSDQEFEAYAAKVGAKVPAGRMGKPEEVAAAVAFLAGNDSRYLLGSEISVDGGFAEI